MFLFFRHHLSGRKALFVLAILTLLALLMLLNAYRPGRQFLNNLTKTNVLKRGSYLFQLGNPGRSGTVRTQNSVPVLKTTAASFTHPSSVISGGQRNPVAKLIPNIVSFLTGKEKHVSGAIGFKIPHIIHQTWRDRNVPRSVVEYIKSWHKHQPSWKYMFWTDEDILRFVKIRYPQFLPTFTSYEAAIMKADAFRYLVLDDIGGLYADVDYESLRSIENFTSKHSCIVSQEPLEHAHLLYDKDRFCCNAILAAAPGHQFFKWLIGELPKIAKSIQKNDIQRKTGPAMLEKAVQDYARIFLNGGKVSKGRELYVATQQELMPQFDIKQWYAFNAKCRQKSLYQGVKRRICEELLTISYKNRPLGDAFSNHHWVHFWGPGFENGYGELVSIDDIAPYRVNVTDYVLKMPPRYDNS